MWKLLVVPAVALLALSFACDDEEVEVAGSPQPTPSPSDATATPEPSPSPSPSPTPDAGVCQENPDPATPEFVVVDEPSAGESVSSPVTVSGEVLAFEATYQIGIFDTAGDPIVETFGTAGPGEVGELAPFSIDVEFTVTEATPVCLWVYEQSARDGSAIHVEQIPLTLLP